MDCFGQNIDKPGGNSDVIGGPGQTPGYPVGSETRDKSVHRCSNFTIGRGQTYGQDAQSSELDLWHHHLGWGFPPATRSPSLVLQH